MDKGTYGYTKKRRKRILISVIILGIAILVGVGISLGMYHTTKTLIILIPILITLPFAKQTVAFIMCAGFRPLSEEEHARVEQELSYENREGILYDISISQYEGMLFFPSVIVRDGRMLFLYRDKWTKRIPNKEALKKEINKAFENIKKPYVVVLAFDLDEFIKKAGTIKEPDADYTEKDRSMREKLFELGV